MVKIHQKTYTKSFILDIITAFAVPCSKARATSCNLQIHMQHPSHYLVHLFAETKIKTLTLEAFQQAY